MILLKEPISTVAGFSLDFLRQTDSLDSSKLNFLILPETTNIKVGIITLCVRAKYIGWNSIITSVISVFQI